MLASIFPHGMTQKSQTARISYAEVVTASLAGTIKPAQPLVNTLDPLLLPVLNPFVEGLKHPIMRKVGEKEREVAQVVAVVGGLCFVSGLVLGTCLSHYRDRDRPPRP